MRHLWYLAEELVRVPLIYVKHGILPPVSGRMVIQFPEKLMGVCRI